MTNNPPLIVVVGATASGKSKLSLKIAQNLQCEIISADSMQVYRGMDIGTAKPSKRYQAIVKHHLVDVLDINQRLDVYYYVKHAEDAIADIYGRNKIPLIVGGSGLYIRALLYGLDPLPSSVNLRNILRQKYQGEDGEKCLINDIAKIDPKAIDVLGCTNIRKLLRAMEVFMLTEKSITEQQAVWSENKLQYNASVYCLIRERSDLFERITRRTDNMLKQGWIEETELLLKKGLLDTPTARQAIGYELISKYLAGNINYEEMKVRIVSSTKKYARRQDTWFKNQHPEAKCILHTQITHTCKSIVNEFTNSSIRT